METFQNILIFKTNIRSAEDVNRIKSSLNNHQYIQQWNVDLHDVDCVLRIVSPSLQHEQIIELINTHGYECTELI
ncbi:MAG: hypothetical protein ACTHMM_19295 [Agriterribacter sp.]